MLLLVLGRGESDGKQEADGKGTQGRAATALKAQAAARGVHFGVWPFEGRLFPQCLPPWPTMMGDMNQMSPAWNNCLSARDTKILV